MPCCRIMRLENPMPEAKLKKALITTPYPTARDLSRILHVPMSRIYKLAEELKQIQEHNARTVPGYPGYAKKARQSQKSGTSRTVTKRAGRARR